MSEGRKREFAAFGWDPALIPDPENPRHFAASKLKWEEAARGVHAEMLEWYRALIRLRRNTPCLNDGTPGKTRVTFYDEEKMRLRMERGNIDVIFNLGAREQVFRVAHGAEVLLASRDRRSQER